MTALLVPEVHVSARDSRRVPAALLLGVLGAIVGFLGSWIPSYWGDEAASVMSATRSWSSLAAELTTIDAVHGVYYAFLKLWTAVFGTTELATRIPSAIATGLMVAGTVVLVRRFADIRLAVMSGAVAIIVPRTTFMATEARSYAITAAAAVWLTVLLVVLVQRHGSARWWALYGVAMAASIYLFLYLGLLLAVHAIYLLVMQRSALRAWLRGAIVASVFALPMVLIAYSQREQISFLARRDYATVTNVLTGQWFGSVYVALICWTLIIVAIGGMLRRRRPIEPLSVLALAWLLVPTAALLIGNATIAPMYNVRYLTFSTPAVAILVASGVMVIARARTRIIAVLIAVLVAVSAPTYFGQRTPWAKDGGSDWRSVAAYVGAYAVPGDAVIFDQTTKPSRDPRLALNLYPGGFTGLHDIALVTPSADTSSLWDITAPLADTTTALTSSVWAVELAAGSKPPADITLLESDGYVIDSATLIHRTTVYHLSKE